MLAPYRISSLDCRLTSNKERHFSSVKKFLALLIISAFVAVQFADIAVFDPGHAATPEVHADLDLDKEKPSTCAIHCGCHVFHHMGPSGQPTELVLALNGAKKLSTGSYLLSDVNRGPPVPPPLA